MRFVSVLCCFWSLTLVAQEDGGEQQAAELRALATHSPQLALEGVLIKVRPLRPDWELGMVSWIAVDRDGLIYLLQRGDKADPIIVLNREGRVLRSWGKGLYTMPHSIRIRKETSGRPTQQVQSSSSSATWERSCWRFRLADNRFRAATISVERQTLHLRQTDTFSSQTGTPMPGCWNTRPRARRSASGESPGPRRVSFGWCIRSRSMRRVSSTWRIGRTAASSDLISKAVTLEAGRTSEKHSRLRLDQDVCTWQRSPAIRRTGLQAG